MLRSLVILLVVDVTSFGCARGPPDELPFDAGSESNLDGGTTEEIDAGVNCTGMVGVFPMLEKSCNTNSDCTFGLHEISCCGTQEAIGFNISQTLTFRSDEALCDTMYPACACVAGSIQTEAGASVGSVSDVTVSCQSGACMTASQ